MLVIGIIGGAGSGKTYYCNYLVNQYHVPFIEGDQIAREVITKNQAVKSRILNHFGIKVFDEMGEVIRSKLGEIVFQDANELLVLNEIMHPAMYRRIKERLEAYHEFPFVLLEAAVMIEARLLELVDRVLYIKADEVLRLERLMQFRGLDKERAMALLHNGRTDYEKYAHEIVISQNNEHDSFSALNRIIKKLLEDDYEKFV